jgi:hypothetical protein
MTDFYKRWGYDVKITVGDLTLDTTLSRGQNGLCDQIHTSYQVGVEAQASFSFIPPEAEFNLNTYQNQLVNILVKVNDVWDQIFTGYVVTPSFDFIGRKITLSCSDNRKARIKALPKAVIAGVGTYSTAIFGKPLDQSDELAKRLQGVTGDFDFDRYGNYYLTPWLPKTIPDYTFSSKDALYFDNPQLTYSNRRNYTNVINIKVDYSYQRLHQQTVVFTWPGYTDFIRDFWNAGQPTFPDKNNIQAAALNGGWLISSGGTGINFTDLWPAQGFANGKSTIVWQPNDVTQELKGRTQFGGYLKTNTIPPAFVTAGDPPKLVPQYIPVLDKNKQQIMDVVKTTVRDTSSQLCRGAVWSAALKFAQNVTEAWSVQLRAPQGILQSSLNDTTLNYTVSDPYDSSKWASNNTVAQVSYNFYTDKKTKVADQHEVLQVALNMARATILQQYRDVTLSWRFVYLQPKLDLRNTVAVNINQQNLGGTTNISARGRVFEVKHFIDFNTTEAYTTCTLKLSRAPGSVTDDTWRYPEVTQNPGYIGIPTIITLGTYVGKDPATTPGSDKWTGWVANHNTTSSGGVKTRTKFNEQFIIDFPAIPDAIRQDLTYNSNAVYNMSIPNDYLETST